MHFKLRKKAVSQIVATILLVAITVAGGLLAFWLWNNMAGIESKKTQVNFDYLALYRSVGEPEAVFASTLKNAGNKPIKLLIIKLHNETVYPVPSISDSSPLEPGESVGVTLTPQTIHAEWYTVGNTYTVTIVQAEATDGSTYSHTTNVMCMGSEAGHAISQQTTFKVSGVHSHGQILTVDEVSYVYPEITEQKPVTFSWPADTPHSFIWAEIIEEAATWTGKRYHYDYCVVMGNVANVSLKTNAGAITVEPGNSTVHGYYYTQYALNVTIVGAGTVAVDSVTVTNSSILWYLTGKNLTATAQPSSMYTFDHWVFDGVNQTADTLSITMNSTHNLTAVFVRPTGLASGYDDLFSARFEKLGGYDALTGVRFEKLGGYDALTGVRFEKLGGYDLLYGIKPVLYGSYDLVAQSYRQLTIKINGSGYTFPRAGNHTYLKGGTAYVWEWPQGGNRFSHWTLDGNYSGSADSITVTMDNNHVLTAYFEPIPTYTLTMSVNNSTMGTTDPAIGSHVYFEGTLVHGTATSNLGYRFSSWLLDGGNAGSANPISVTMNANHWLQAVFVPVPTYTLTMSVNNSTMGSTNPSVGDHVYFEGTSVKGTATPNVGYKFSYWLLDGTVETANPKTVVMNSNHALKAYFEQSIVNVTFSASEVKQGLTILTVDSVDYSSSALPTFKWQSGSSHVFKWYSPVSSGTGERYVWSSTSGLSTKQSETIITPETDGTITATYHKEYLLTISVSPVAWGTATPAPGSHWYTSGANVQVQAQPEVGYQLDHWTKDGSPAGSLNPITVTMDNPHSVTAYFSQVDLGYLAKRLATCVGGAPAFFYINPYSYVAGFVEQQEIRDHLAGVQITFKAWSGGWSDPETVSLGESAIFRMGSVVKIWYAYLHLNTGNSLQIKYEGHEEFYLYYNSTSHETDVTAENPVGEDPSLTVTAHLLETNEYVALPCNLTGYAGGKAYIALVNMSVFNLPNGIYFLSAPVIFRGEQFLMWINVETGELLGTEAKLKLSLAENTYLQAIYCS